MTTPPRVTAPAVVADAATPPLRRPPELDGVGLAASAVIEASAGTGKTYLLEHLVLELLITGRARLDQILIVTFTERATAELVSRVRQKIDQALAVPPSSTNDFVPTGWKIDAAARRRLSEARRSFDQATIATIHAFCQRVLIDEPLATRRLLGQTQVDGQQAFAQAFREVLRRTLATADGHREYLDAYLAAGRSTVDLENILYRAATARGAWGRIYDESMFARAAALFAAVNPDALDLEKSVRGVLHSSSAGAMFRRLRRLVPEARLCVARRSWGALLGCFDAQADVFNWIESLAAIPEVRPEVRPLQLVCQNLLEAAPPLDEVIAQRFLPLVQEELRGRKLTEGLYDYDDMIASVAEALDSDVGPALVEKMRARYRFALVDEAQDTEPAQWKIFRRIFLDSDGENPVVLIGDPKQAIYSFRGADVHTYVDAREEIRARGGTFMPLTLNHRSHSEVVAGYNAVFDHAGTPRFFDGVIAYDHPVTAARPALGGGPGVTLMKVETPADSTAPGRIGAIRYALRDAIVHEIDTLKSTVAGLRLSEVYVLARSNAEAREVAGRLHAAGIANVLYKPDNIFKCAEAIHVRALLLAIADPADRALRLGAWLTPFFDVTLEALAGSGEPPPDHPLIARLTAWKSLADNHAYDQLWGRILDDSGVARRLRLAPSGLRRLTNYRHLFDLLHAETAARPLSIEDLAALLGAFLAGRRRPGSADDQTQRLETEADAVRVMTVHAAKGLEADYVFVYGGLTARRDWRSVHTFHQGTARQLCAGKPRRKHTIELIDGDGREEAQRLLYVAMTRARKHLYLPFFPAAEPGELESSQERGGDFDFFRRISGVYLPVNERLRALDRDEERRKLFRTLPVPLGAQATPGDNVALAALGDWVPPSVIAAGGDPDAALTAWIRARRRGFVMTSYSRLKEAQGGYHRPAPHPMQDDHGDADGERAGDNARPRDGEGEGEGEGDGDALALIDPLERLETPFTAEPILPGGAATGLFLHAVLEKVPLGRIEALETWQRQPKVRQLIESELRRWDREPRHFEAAARLVHAALTVAIATTDDGILPGIAQATRVRREVDFLFPLPHDRLSEYVTNSAENRLVHERGFVRGFLDVLFEHAGRIHFADWKSDVLPSFDEESVSAHVEANYELQVQLYTLAVIRMLGITNEADYDRRFGGLVYLFLRGLNTQGSDAGPSGGVYVRRPSYQEALDWQRQLETMPISMGPGAS